MLWCLLLFLTMRTYSSVHRLQIEETPFRITKTPSLVVLETIRGGFFVFYQEVTCNDEEKMLSYAPSGEGGEMSTVAPSPSWNIPTLSVYRTALMASFKRISVVPIPPNGTKCPHVKWRVYQQRRATSTEITRWFADSNDGIAFITGAVSGGLEVLDFDTREVYEQWSEQMHAEGLGTLHTRLTNGYLEATPNGIHLLYRCCVVEGNQKLAQVVGDGPHRLKAVIETRGEGGLIVVAPSHGGVHPSGKPYVLLQGSITTIQTVSAVERQTLFTIARRFNTLPSPPFASSPTPSSRQNLSRETRRPGDLYNERVSWAEVLEPHGWTLLTIRDGQGYWLRPGKEGPGISATTNYHGSDLLYVFSTSTVFEAGHGYSKFAAYAMLEHGADFSTAAKALLQQGYCDTM